MDKRFIGEGRSLTLDLSDIRTYDANIRTNLVTIDNLMTPSVTPHEDFFEEGFDE